MIVGSLLPLLNQPSLLAQQYERLFGTVNPHPLEQLKQQLQHYDVTPDSLQEDNLIEFLISDKLRPLLVAYMQEHATKLAPFTPNDEKYAERLVKNLKPRTWGDHQEIIALSGLLQQPIQVDYTDTGRASTHTAEFWHLSYPRLDTVHLVYVNNNHYHVYLTTTALKNCAVSAIPSF